MYSCEHVFIYRMDYFSVKTSPGRHASYRTLVIMPAAM
jgi:hypothetical protein